MQYESRKSYSKENDVDVVGINDGNNSNEDHNGETLRCIDTKFNESEQYQVPCSVNSLLSTSISRPKAAAKDQNAVKSKNEMKNAKD